MKDAVGQGDNELDFNNVDNEFYSDKIVNCAYSGCSKPIEEGTVIRKSENDIYCSDGCSMLGLFESRGTSSCISFAKITYRKNNDI